MKGLFLCLFVCWFGFYLVWIGFGFGAQSESMAYGGGEDLVFEAAGHMSESGECRCLDFSLLVQNPGRGVVPPMSRLCLTTSVNLNLQLSHRYAQKFESIVNPIKLTIKITEILNCKFPA